MKDADSCKFSSISLRKYESLIILNISISQYPTTTNSDKSRWIIFQFCESVDFGKLIFKD